jgi:hypothetical protein
MRQIFLYVKISEFSHSLGQERSFAYDRKGRTATTYRHPISAVPLGLQVLRQLQRIVDFDAKVANGTF